MITHNGETLTKLGIITRFDDGKIYRLVEEPKQQPTVEQMTDLLVLGQDVICRNGARGRLTGELKRRIICTRQRRLENGDYLFTKCEPRLFKGGLAK